MIFQEHAVNLDPGAEDPLTCTMVPTTVREDVRNHLFEGAPAPPTCLRGIIIVLISQQPHDGFGIAGASLCRGDGNNRREHAA